MKRRGEAVHEGFAFEARKAADRAQRDDDVTTAKAEALRIEASRLEREARPLLARAKASLIEALAEYRHGLAPSEQVKADAAARSASAPSRCDLVTGCQGSPIKVSAARRAKEK